LGLDSQILYFQLKIMNDSKGLINEKKWWNYVHEDIRELILQSILLTKTAEKWEKDITSRIKYDSFNRHKFHDYSFIVFPAAKAYEGFLKKVFLDLGFITEEDYFGKHFRIGKALNPSLEKRLRISEGVYDKVVKYCSGEALAKTLWSTWKDCRNLLFHWFPNERNAISLEEARGCVDKVIFAMDQMMTECNLQ